MNLLLHMQGKARRSFSFAGERLEPEGRPTSPWLLVVGWLRASTCYIEGKARRSFSLGSRGKSPRASCLLLVHFVVGSVHLCNIFKGKALRSFSFASKIRARRSS